MNCTEGDMERKKNVGEKGEDSLEGTVGRFCRSVATLYKMKCWLLATAVSLFGQYFVEIRCDRLQVNNIEFKIVA